MLCYTHKKFKTSISGLVLKKVHRMIKFNQNAQLKLYVVMKKSKFRKKTKNDFEKDFFKLMNNVNF